MEGCPKSRKFPNFPEVPIVNSINTLNIYLNFHLIMFSARIGERGEGLEEGEDEILEYLFVIFRERENVFLNVVSFIFISEERSHLSHVPCRSALFTSNTVQTNLWLFFHFPFRFARCAVTTAAQ